MLLPALCNISSRAVNVLNYKIKSKCVASVEEVSGFRIHFWFTSHLVTAELKHEVRLTPDEPRSTVLAVLCSRKDQT